MTDEDLRQHGEKSCRSQAELLRILGDDREAELSPTHLALDITLEFFGPHPPHDQDCNAWHSFYVWVRASIYMGQEGRKLLRQALPFVSGTFTAELMRAAAKPH